MDTIWDIYKWLQFITDTNRNGACSPEEASMALGSAQALFFEDCIRRSDTNALRELHGISKAASAPTGIAPYPPGYAHLNAVMHSGVVLEEIAHGEIYERANSVLYAPTYNKPVFVREKSGLQLYPILEYPEIEIHYTASPASPKIAYSVSLQGEAIYDPASSVPLSFPKEYWTKIALGACPFLGVNLGARDVFSLTQLNVPEGDQQS